MPSHFAELYGDFAVPVLGDQLGEEVSWYALGDMTVDPVPIQGIFNEESASDDTHRGKEEVRKASLGLPSSRITRASMA